MTVLPPSIQDRTSVTNDLAEDWLTSWVVDVAGHADAPLTAEESPRWKALIQWLTVPKPDGGRMIVPVLDPSAHLALHAVAAPLRDALDDALGGGVFGYRRGADPTARYAVEWQRLQASAADLTESAAYVVVADVKRFFPVATWDRVIAAVAEITPDVQPLQRLATVFEHAGLPHLPAGYGDARLLANAVLHQFDRQLPVPFVRWVDDYTLFVPATRRPGDVIQELARNLASIGLELNQSKTLILTREEASRRYTNTLGDLYRPEEDPPDVLRAALHRIFATAMADPPRRRRELRFALARLERERDDWAIDAALDLLDTAPWEAPRVVSYLSLFEGDHRVRDRIDLVLQRAARSGDGWLVARIGPLTYKTGMSDATSHALAESLPRLRATPAWGLALRALALNGLGRRVSIEIKNEGPLSDPRAALVALRDLEMPLDIAACREEPAIAALLASDLAPLPSLHSLL